MGTNFLDLLPVIFFSIAFFFFLVKMVFPLLLTGLGRKLNWQWPVSAAQLLKSGFDFLNPLNWIRILPMFFLPIRDKDQGFPEKTVDPDDYISPEELEEFGKW
jgi:hypothetical protein